MKHFFRLTLVISVKSSNRKQYINMFDRLKTKVKNKYIKNQNYKNILFSKSYSNENVLHISSGQ